MPRSRRTHNYPGGKPLPLVLLMIPTAVLCICWVVLVPGHWPRAICIIAVALLLLFIDGKLHEHYERTGQAVRIPRPPRTRTDIQFLQGVPRSLWAARIAFGTVVVTMFVFGLGPFADATAKIGIIACIFALFGVAILKVGLESIYVRTGRAREIKVPRDE